VRDIARIALEPLFRFVLDIGLTPGLNHFQKDFQGVGCIIIPTPVDIRYMVVKL